MSWRHKQRYLAIGLAIILLDQLSKGLVARALPFNSPRSVIPGFFSLWRVHNPGGVWGLFSGHAGGLVPALFTALAIAALLVVLFFFLRAGRHEKLELFAYAFILGGALGNIADRLRLGYVIDFIDLYVGQWHWPTFNIADSAISTGVVLLALSLWRKPCTPS